MKNAAVKSLAVTSLTGLGTGAFLGLMLAWLVFVEHPVIASMVSNGPAPVSTLITLFATLCGTFAVGAALTAVTISLLNPRQ